MALRRFSVIQVAFVCLSAVVTCSALAIPSATELASNSAKGLRLLELDETSDPIWVTEAEKLDLLRAGKNFFDITESFQPLGSDSSVASLTASTRLSRVRLPQASITYPTAPSKQAAVTPLLSQISLATMQSFLSNLTSFENRHFTSETGIAASLWIHDTLSQIIASNPGTNASVSLFNHTAFPQQSIVARFPGLSVSNDTSDPGQSAALTILGAHMDSINLDDVTGPAPGADDDGSGSVNLLEAFRVLVGGGFAPQTPVEFHWYAAEEEGLLGSQDIANSYANEGIVVKGMLQLDMTAFVRPGSEEVISLMPDFTNDNLTAFVGSLIDEYSALNWTINNPCGYACSDHASWDRNGYPTALPFEGTFPDNANSFIHSADDTVDAPGFSWNHTLEYTKIAIAYAFELAS